MRQPTSRPQRSVTVDDPEGEALDMILASWQSETPISDDIRRAVAAELDIDQAGLAGHSARPLGRQQ